MKSPLISKIRSHSPNLKSKTPIRNYNYLYYIATREGTDLSELKTKISNFNVSNFKEANNELYLKYIHERPRSNGLFGNIDTNDFLSVCNHVKNISKNQVIFRGIISLSEIDANVMGYTTKDKWKELLDNNLPAIGNILGINPTDLTWVAAFHNEKSHPHVHYMLWSKSNSYPINYFISIPKQQKCRELLSKEIFKEDYLQYRLQKTTFRDLLITDAKNSIDNFIFGYAKKNDIHLNNKPLHIPGELLNNSSKLLLLLLESLPTKGRLAYKFLPEESKELLKELMDNFLEKSELKKAYNKYIDISLNLAKTYSPTNKELSITKSNAKKDIDTRLCNVILNSIKKLRSERKFYFELLDKNKFQNKESIFTETNISKINDFINKQKELSTADNSIASYKLGELYYKNILVKDTEKAIKYYKASANLGNKDALTKLGIIYLYGKRTKQNIPLGLDYLYKAKEKNSILAQETINSHDCFVENNIKRESYSLFSSILNTLTSHTLNNILIHSNFKNLNTDNKKELREYLINKYGKKENEYDLER